MDLAGSSSPKYICQVCSTVSFCFSSSAAYLFMSSCAVSLSFNLSIFCAVAVFYNILSISSPDNHPFSDISPALWDLSNTGRIHRHS